jgi:hypothetical protein
MARRRQSDRRLTVTEVAALVDERFPAIVWDPEGDDDWNRHVARCARRRAARRALADEYGYTPLDLFYAEFGRRR